MEPALSVLGYKHVKWLTNTFCLDFSSTYFYNCDLENASKNRLKE